MNSMAQISKGEPDALNGLCNDEWARNPPKAIDSSAPAVNIYKLSTRVIYLPLSDD
jgi:hypothetical protein